VQALYGKPLSMSLLTVPVSPNFISRVLMLTFVHHLSENSFINFIALYPFKRYKFLAKLLSSSLNTMFTKTVVTSAMTQF